jgi:hypothetical protein
MIKMCCNVHHLLPMLEKVPMNMEGHTHVLLFESKLPSPPLHVSKDGAYPTGVLIIMAA